MLRLDDREVMLEVRCRRGVGVNGSQFAGTTHVFKEISILEKLGKGDEFNGLPVVVEFVEYFKEGSVRGNIEMLGGKVLLDGSADIFGWFLKH